jgi:hypothetical protein
MKMKAKQQRSYFLIFIALLGIEILIAIFVHDGFVRPYIGDVLAVGVVYYFIRTFIPKRIALLPLYVFLFAAVIEILQLFDFAGQVGLEHPILKIIAGSVFDWKDIGCYAVGCAIIAVVDVMQLRIVK